MKDVAARTGVSVATVSRVLAGQPHVRPEIRAKVEAAVEALGYVPNRSARSLRLQRSSILGLIIPDIENPFFTSVARAVEDAARQHQLAVFLCNSDEQADKERMYLSLLQAEKVAGVILAPTQRDAEHYRTIGRTMPLIAIDRTVAGAEFDSVVTDNAEAAEQLVGALIARGHERIAALFAEQHITTARQRFEGYRAALRAAGLPFDDTLVRTGPPVIEAGYRLGLELFRRPDPPRALFAATKLMTLGAVRALSELGLRVPDDVVIAAYDNPGYLPLNAPDLFAEQPTYQIGQQAVALLLQRLADPDHPPLRRVLTSTIVTRSS